MSALKRKNAPGGDPPSKSAKSHKESGPSKTPFKKVSKPFKKDDGKDYKPKPKDDEKPRNDTAGSLVNVREEEPMFPRGGASILTPMEKREINVQARADALREDELGVNTDKPERKKKKTSAKSKKSGDKEPEFDNVKVESLNFKVGCPARPQPEPTR